MITYGLSIYGPDLWIVGFPMAWTENNLSLELRLVDSKTDKTLFSKTYNATLQKTLSWLYVIRNDFNYADMLGEVNKQFCHDLEPVVLEAAKEEPAPAAK
jgi:curli biogenesis system outer membrane secretion channel CsgG